MASGLKACNMLSASFPTFQRNIFSYSLSLCDAHCSSCDSMDETLIVQHPVVGEGEGAGGDAAVGKGAHADVAGVVAKHSDK